ncbi:hypothetical protein [Guptibacillus algicola]|uniref:hypothetical protein n=1 Tax=Guptibacillus algicola TaxID=225844 RepID=UPI001CD5BCAB|nr:hypothetical protein [Alkalihalobacillus algicola]MCA0989379.1 hypothetical protein [Alkalihalobacillus algicola]
MDRFDELIQLQLELADKMIHTRNEIQQIEEKLQSTEVQEPSSLMKRKQELVRMEEDFNNLITEVISTFEKTSV